MASMTEGRIVWVGAGTARLGATRAEGDCHARDGLLLDQLGVSLDSKGTDGLVGIRDAGRA